jgi:phosphatidate cytidylyltransferase
MPSATGASATSPEIARMLNRRFLPGVFLIGSLIVLAVWAPLWAMLPALLAVSGLATGEHLRLLERRQIPAWPGVAWAGALLLPTAGFLQAHLPGLHLLPATLGLLMIALFLRQMGPAQDDLALPRLAGTAFALLYVPLACAFMGLLLHPAPGRDGRLLLLFLIVVTKLCDMGAYFTGSAIGRTKLIPRISPNKTWEGCVGGLVWSAVAGWVFLRLSGGEIAGLRFTLTDVLILAPLCGMLGILGDLAKSVMKRAAGVKDSGTLFAGMGGMLDVVDSLLFTAPALYIYVSIFPTPV